MCYNFLLRYQLMAYYISEFIYYLQAFQWYNGLEPIRTSKGTKGLVACTRIRYKIDK
jgi:hypothetical protein